MNLPKIMLAAMAALSLSACSIADRVLAPGSTPAPLAQTKVDETALRAAWGFFDVALDGLNLWMDAKPSVIGTPAAKRIADAVDAVNAFLTTAQIAADAGNSGDYTEAMAKAKVAISDLKAAISAAMVAR
jgi:hypothetical protein